jgi:hypothetical protein
VPTPSLAELFRVAPLPRWRAVFAIICAGAAFLCAGGMLEYGSGSPETHGTRAATYWALLFALHVVAFGGAGLLAAFPALAHPLIKLVWLGLVMGVYGLAFAVWERQQPAGMGGVNAWLARWPAYLPAIVATVIGMLLRRTSSIPDDSQAGDAPAPPGAGDA